MDDDVDDVDGGDADDDALHASWKNDDSYASGKNCVWSACSCAASGGTSARNDRHGRREDGEDEGGEGIG